MAAFAAAPPAPGSPPPQNAIAPADALKRLMEGNARYVANTPNERDFSATRAARAQAQYPIAAIKPSVIVAEKTKTGSLLDNATSENVRRQVARLKNSPPVIQKLYAGKKIDIVGGMYEIATGKVTLL